MLSRHLDLGAGDEFEYGGDAAFHLVHGGTLGVHVARFAGLAAIVGYRRALAVAVRVVVAVDVCVGGWSVIQRRSITGLRTVGGCDTILTCNNIVVEIPIFCILIATYTTAASRWSASFTVGI